MTEYIACLILAFALIQLLVALVNLFFRERLPEREDAIQPPSLSLLIPARDEETNIVRLLNDLVTVSDRIREIIVFDDQSADDTARIVEEFAAHDFRIRLIRGGELPGGWSGKNHACCRLAKEATGNYLLFLDADVRVGEGVIDRSMCYMQRWQCDLMSIFPTQEMRSIGEKITVPNMQIILLTLLPLPLVRLSGLSSLSAANGQFMMFKRKTYEELEPHRQFPKSRAEDIEIARYLKRERRRVSCLTGIEGVRCRMYRSLPEAVEGFSKNVTYFFGNSSPAAILYWLVTSLGFIVFIVAGRCDGLWLWLATTLLARIAASLTAGLKAGYNLLLFLPQQLMLGVFILRSLVNKRKKTFRWKGRSI
ncbi:MULTISPECIES: glycosyltransferase family 2 protein [Proteiniphilum]|jgi:glycosyltransferase involved in cell wall biosynthesis|uniref:glycosyltransferase family 2 protein n=1 Tax=Proteiniphilum TaxID=294702 RepID=UPI001EECACA5|nr:MULTISPECIES: glycosyltransferase family 2 protein [Proteiniphilum]MDD4632331.1 glycosyltransferase family 2 protein [Proteiniphilum sp.]ULB33880.1 glycosyltransferase [Proteiniphilum propionicum]